AWTALLWLGRPARASLSARCTRHAELPTQPALPGSDQSHRQRRPAAGRGGSCRDGQPSLAAAGLGPVQSPAEPVAGGWRTELGAERALPGVHRLRRADAFCDAAGLNVAD